MEPPNNVPELNLDIARPSESEEIKEPIKVNGFAAKPNVGESNYKHTEKSVKEASFIPTEIAVSVVAKIQEDDKKLLERHVKLAEVIRQNFLKIEEETQKHTIEFFNNLKTKISEKLSTCKQAYISLTKEKEDVQSKYHAMYTTLAEKYKQLQHDAAEKFKQLEEDKEKEIKRFEATIKELKNSYETQMEKNSEGKNKVVENCEKIIKDKEEVIAKTKKLEQVVKLQRDRNIRDVCAIELDLLIGKVEYEAKMGNLRKEIAFKEQKIAAMALEKSKFDASKIEYEPPAQEEHHAHNKIRISTLPPEGDAEAMKKYEALLKDKNALSIKINKWCSDFEKKEGRKATVAEKEPIKALYVEYKELKKKMMEAYQDADRKNQNDLNVSGVSEGIPQRQNSNNNMSIYESKMKSAESEELRLENTNLKNELSELREQLTNGINETTAIKQLKSEIDKSKKEADGWRIKYMEHNAQDAKNKLREFEKVKKERDQYKQRLSILEENMSENLMKTEIGRLTGENEELKKKAHELENISNRAAEFELNFNNKTEECNKLNLQLQTANDQLSLTKQKAEKYDSLLIEVENLKDKAVKEGADKAIMENNTKLQTQNLEYSILIESLRKINHELSKNLKANVKGDIKGYIERIEKDNNDLTEKVNTYHKMETELDQLRLKMTTMTTKDATVETMKGEMARLQDENVLLNDKLNKFKDVVNNTKEMRAIIETQKKDIFEIKETANEAGKLKDDNMQLKNTVSALQEQVNRLRDSLSKPSENDANATSQLKAELANVNKEKENIEQNFKIIQASYTECQDHKQKIESLEEELAQLRTDLTRAEQDRDRLKGKAESTAASKSHINQLRLMLAKAGGNEKVGSTEARDKDAAIAREMNRIIKENSDLTNRLEKSERSNKDTKVFMEKYKENEKKAKDAFARIRELEKANQALQSTKPAINNEQATKFREEKKELEKQLKLEQAAAKQARAEVEKLKLRMESTKDKELLALNEQIKKQESSHKAESQAMEKRHFEELSKKDKDLGKLLSETKKMQDEYEKLKKEKSDKEATLASLSKTYQKMEVDLDRYKKASELMIELEKQKTAAEVESKAAKEKSVILEKKYKEEMVKRKKAHNMLEDMKGKIRVFCRVRPMNDKERELGCTSVVAISDEFTVNLETNAGVKQFQFDSCFPSDASQESVFEDTKRLIQSAIDGYNVCIFAYGQTSSGKTYTIQGPEGNPGVAPRSFMELFELMKINNNVIFKFECYMVELYMNHLKDLMYIPGTNGEPPKLEIKEDIKGMISVQNTTIKPFTTLEEVQRYFNIGLQNRQTGKTMMNDTSSRSHLVFVILINSENKQTGQKTFSKLSFVDLAGSERVAKSGATAERLKEGSAINQSLSILGDVIAALSEDTKKFVPYRNNKLTMLMKDSLGGNSKTLMFVNVSPASYNLEETKTSLYYATRVKKITNDTQKNVENMQIINMRNKYNTLLRALDVCVRTMRTNKVQVPQEVEQYSVITEEEAKEAEDAKKNASPEKEDIPLEDNASPQA